VRNDIYDDYIPYLDRYKQEHGYDRKSDHHRMAPDHRPAASPVTSGDPVRAA
jgi:hypothetical protein